jgi:hypothetical protein
MAEILVMIGTFLAVLCILLVIGWKPIRDAWVTAEWQKRVWWVGGPWDGSSFTVPRSKRTITVGSTWMDVDLDVGGPQVRARRVEQWPIERSFWRHYVVWREEHDG